MFVGIVLAIALWSVYGNLNETVREHGLLILSLACIGAIIATVITWVRVGSIKIIWLIVSIVLALVPISSAAGNLFNLSVQFMIAYAAGTITLFSLLRKELQ